VQGRAQSAAAAVSSGAWGAGATAATTAPYGTGPMSLSFPALSVSARFLTVGNTGALTVTAAAYTASSSNGLVTVKIEACNSGWNETANTCSGLTTTVVDTAVSSTASAAFSTSSSLPFGPGLHVRLRATPSVGALTGTTLTVAVSVARNQVRAGTLTNS
jgi:hypothetical protein